MAERQPELDDFQELMERIRAGSSEAARELVEEYGPYLLRAVRKRLSKKLRPKFDSADFVQDVWASFFAHLPEKTFQRPAEVVAFLTKLARNKIVEAVRQRMQTRAFNVNREQSLDDPTVPAEELVASRPTPAEIVSGREEWEVFLKKQPLVYQRILILRRNGQTPKEIARELGVSERMVQRVTRKLIPQLMS